MKLSFATVLIAMGAFVQFGCSANPAVNPSFSVTNDCAFAALEKMKAHPKPLVRPLIIVGGYQDPGVGAYFVRSQLAKAFDDDRIIGVSLVFSPTFEDCRAKIIAAVDEAYPNSDKQFTTEVDVIGVSMGGLAARHAALVRPDQRSLKIARLFTVSSPLQGATLASWRTWDQRQRDMRIGSPFYRQFDAPDALQTSHQIFCYTRLNDEIVGEQNAAPRGEVAWWVRTPAGQLAHIGAATDPRILADITRRLRGETPFSKRPPAPLPAI